MNSNKNLSDVCDYIFIDNLEVSCRIGTTAEERAFPQVLFLSVRLHLPLRQAGEHDNINQTVDYAVVISAIKSHLESTEFYLVEAAAESIAGLILKDKLIVATQVRIAKKIFPGVDRVGVKIFRSQK